MDNVRSFDISTIDDLMSATQLICSNMNIGLIVHHMEDLKKIKSIRFIYANDEASKYTGTDLSKLVGKYFHEAFPEVAKSDLPEMFAGVAHKKKACTIGVMEYSDENVKKGYYAIKAFPLPNDCIGVAFENITDRKQLEKMIKDYTDQLRKKNEELERLMSTIYNEVAVPLRKIHAKGEDLKSRSKNLLPKKDIKYLEEITETSRHLVQLIEEHIISSRDKKPNNI